MLKITKLTDYGTVVMAYLAKNNKGQITVHTAKDIAEHTHIALPTVSKLLKLLARAGLLVAQRGVKGGYSLAYPPEVISLAQVLYALEGDVSLTECSHHQAGLCAMESLCAIRDNWRTISGVLHETLKNISLADMIKPMTSKATRQNIVDRLSKIKPMVKAKEYSYDRSRN